MTLTPEDTTSGAVETWADAARARNFSSREEKIDGILVTLPNSGNERSIADAIRLSGLDVPVLIHAFPDEPGRMDIDRRRDSYCGKVSVCMPSPSTGSATPSRSSTRWTPKRRSSGRICAILLRSAG